MPASLLCSAVPWEKGCRTSLPQSAELCSSPLSPGLHFSHHTAPWAEGMVLWSIFIGFLCLQYLFRYVHSPQHLIGFWFFFFRLFLLPALLYRYRMEIKDICLRAIKGICLKIVMSQIPIEYFRALLWSPIHLSQSELPFLHSHWNATFLQLCFWSILQAWTQKMENYIGKKEIKSPQIYLFFWRRLSRTSSFQGETSYSEIAT